MNRQIYRWFQPIDGTRYPDRPNSLNTLNDGLIPELYKTIFRAESDDDDVRAIVLVGSGDEVFSTGCDITPQGNTSDVIRQLTTSRGLRDYNQSRPRCLGV